MVCSVLVTMEANVCVLNSVDEVRLKVSSIEQRDKVQFVKQRSTKGFASEDWIGRHVGKSIMWEDYVGDIPFDGIPFIVLAQQTLECRSGPQRHIRDQQKRLQPKEGDPFAHRRKNKLQPSIKLGCPAKVVVRELVKFPSFQINSNTESRRKSVSSRLRTALTTKIESIETRRCFIVRFPGTECHRNHFSESMSTVRQAIDRRLIAKVYGLVSSGVCRLPDVRRHLSDFVQNELFAGQQSPPQTDTRFWPSSTAVMNTIYRARMAKRKKSVADEANTASVACDGGTVEQAHGTNDGSCPAAVGENDAVEVADSESFRLVLPTEVVDLLPQVVPNSILHINAINSRGNAVKLVCSLDADGLIVLDFKGAKSDVCEMSGQLVSIASIVQPAYLLTSEEPRPADANSTVFTAVNSQPSAFDNYTADLTNIAGTVDVPALCVDSIYDDADQPDDPTLDGDVQNDYDAEQRLTSGKSRKNSPAGGSVKYYKECDVCHKSVLRRRFLAHQRVYHRIGVRDHNAGDLKCVYCPQRFVDTQQLTCHLRKHKGELLVICLLCHKTFLDEIIAQAHIIHVHCADYRYSCTQCGRGFWKNSLLQQHDCTPADHEHNMQRRVTRTEKISLLRQLSKRLYAVIDPFGQTPCDESTGAYIRLCLQCRKSFSDQIAFDFHSCSLHSSLCTSCGQCFVSEDQLCSHDCSTALTKTIVQSMCVSVPYHRDIVSIIGNDAAMFEDYESDDEHLRGGTVSRRCRVGNQQKTSAAHDNIEPVKRERNVVACMRRRRRERLLWPSDARDIRKPTAFGVQNVTTKKVSKLDIESRDESRRLDDTDSDKADIEQLNCEVVGRRRENMPVVPSPYGTRKRKICFVALANGNSPEDV